MARSFGIASLVARNTPRLAFLDELRAQPRFDKAERRIKILRVLFERVRVRQQFRTVVDVVHAGRAELGVGDDAAGRALESEATGEARCRQPERIAKVGWTENWNLHGGSSRYSPYGESLPEIRVVMRPAPRVGDIDETEGADRGVDGEALRRIPGPFDIALQDIVSENDRLSDIVGEIVNAPTQLRGHILDVGPRNRLQDDIVEKFVGFEDLAVDRFRRVVVAVDPALFDRIARRSTERVPCLLRAGREGEGGAAQAST